MFFSTSKLRFYDPAYIEAYKAADNWPDDLVELDAETYRTYGADSPPLGRRLTADADGMPAWEDIPPDPAETRRTRAITAIDNKAGEVRTAFASNGAFVDAEYEQALASAQSWTEAGRPADAVPDDVQAWADATGNSAEWAADDIISTAEQWRTVLTAIRRVRLCGKEAVRQAADDADFDALAAEYLEQLEQIAAAVPADT